MDKKILIVVVVIAAGTATYRSVNNRSENPIASTDSQTIPSLDLDLKDAEENAATELREETTTPGGSGLLRAIPGVPTYQDLIDRHNEIEHVARYRMVEIESDRLRQLIREGPADGVQLNLFDDVSVTANGQVREEYTSGGFTGFATLGGDIKGFEGRSYIVLTVEPNNSVIAEIGSTEGRYFITPLGDPGHHLIWQEDPNYRMRID